MQQLQRQHRMSSTVYIVIIKFRYSNFGGSRAETIGHPYKHGLIAQANIQMLPATNLPLRALPIEIRNSE